MVSQHHFGARRCRSHHCLFGSGRRGDGQHGRARRRWHRHLYGPRGLSSDRGGRTRSIRVVRVHGVCGRHNDIRRHIIGRAVPDMSGRIVLRCRAAACTGAAGCGRRAREGTQSVQPFIIPKGEYDNRDPFLMHTQQNLAILSTKIQFDCAQILLSLDPPPICAC
jgi:hypothetical protein